MVFSRLILVSTTAATLAPALLISSGVAERYGSFIILQTQVEAFDRFLLSSVEQQTKLA